MLEHVTRRSLLKDLIYHVLRIAGYLINRYFSFSRGWTKEAWTSRHVEYRKRRALITRTNCYSNRCPWHSVCEVKTPPLSSRRYDVITDSFENTLCRVARGHYTRFVFLINCVLPRLGKLFLKRDSLLLFVTHFNDLFSDWRQNFWITHNGFLFLKTRLCPFHSILYILYI